MSIFKIFPAFHRQSLAMVLTALFFVPGMVAQEADKGEDKPSSKKEKGPGIQVQVDQEKKAALEHFKKLRMPSAWQELLIQKVGPLKFEEIPTSDAVKTVAASLHLPLEAAPGVEGTVTYNRDGTLGDFVKDGLQGRYWFLTLKDGKLILQPNVIQTVTSVSSEQGLYFSERPGELADIAKKCGKLDAYRESLTIDAAGAVTIRGRVCFIDRVKKNLKIQD